MRGNVLYIVVPCYKEEEVLPKTAQKLKEKMLYLIQQNKIDSESKILFVNDGSTDKTWNIVENLHMQDGMYSGISLSRNRGHQNALLAGLMVALNYADMIISMDADLQDDVNAVDAMIDLYEKGYDIVYGVRSSRKKDSFIKRNTAQCFYKLMKILGVDIIYNHADYRLMSNRALEGLAQFQEANLFLRGIVPQIGYSWTTVEYERSERAAGESKYPFGKMISFALDGITSFSVKPIRFIAVAGFLVFLISIGALIWAITDKLAGRTVAGWASQMVSTWMIGGIQLLSIGLIGEYIGKIYIETKSRPRYIIETILNSGKQREVTDEKNDISVSEKV